MWGRGGYCYIFTTSLDEFKDWWREVLILMLLKVSHFRISSTCVFFTSISIVPLVTFLIIVGFISFERISSILNGNILVTSVSSMDCIIINIGVFSYMISSSLSEFSKCGLLVDLFVAIYNKLMSFID